MNTDENPNQTLTPEPTKPLVPQQSEPTVPLPEHPPVDIPVAAPVSTTPTGIIGSSSSSNTDGVWVPKAEYNALVEDNEKQIVKNKRRTVTARLFYTFLATSGLLLAILYIGMLLAPGHYYSKGNCTTGFLGIAFWLNPVAYIALLVTGINGVMVDKFGIKLFGILLIIASPIGWFLTGISIIGVFLCGV